MFEAKGIQRYIFASGKLRDVVGASDLVAGLANSDGGKPGSPDKIGKFWNDAASFSRRAGGAFCIHSGDKAALVLLRARWRLHVLTELPGLEFVDVIAAAQGDNPLDAMRACFREAGGIRANYPAEVPGLGRPISKIAPLTGRPAVRVNRYGDKLVLVDAIGLPQRVHADKTKLDNIAKRFVADAGQYKFPRNYDDGPEVDPDDNPVFPFAGDDKRIAVIHADLSGLGELFRNMGAESGFTVQQNFNLAKLIEDAITNAVRGAVACKIVPHAVDNVLPARPVLLGGDDITIIVRADLAIQFTVKLLENIEAQCKHIGAPNEHVLSACAGIAIVGKGTPFLTAYALADDLCGHAKQAVKAALVEKDGRNGYASAYSFHVYQHTAHDSYEGTIAETEVDARGEPLSANPYLVGDRKVEAIDLIDLAQALANIEGGHNRVREIKALISDNIDLAKAAWERWFHVGEKSALQALGDGTFMDGSSGIFDAMTLIDLGAVAKKQAKAAA